MPRALPRNLWILSAVSLLTDLSTEMGFPLLPLYLTTLGGGALVLGLMEGAAESVSAFLKYYSGRLSDRWRRRKGLTILGYGFSALNKAAFPFAQLPWHLGAFRTLDRVGKGIRSAPRDALIADSVPRARWGLGFGLHRTSDTVGALLGPAAALLLVPLLTLREIFLVAAIPALLGVALLPLVREPRTPPKSSPPNPRDRFWTPALSSYLLVVAVFTMGNLSMAFLLLRATELGLPVRDGLLLYVLYNATYALLALPMGAVTDRVGRAPLVAAAFGLLAVANFLVASTRGAHWTDLAPAAFAFGLASAGYEGNGRALAAELAPAGARGRGLGAYHATIGFAALPAGLLAGLLWGIDYRLTYIVAALLAAIALAEFLWVWYRHLGFRARPRTA